MNTFVNNNHSKVHELYTSFYLEFTKDGRNICLCRKIGQDFQLQNAPSSSTVVA